MTGFCTTSSLYSQIQTNDIEKSQQHLYYQKIYLFYIPVYIFDIPNVYYDCNLTAVECDLSGARVTILYFTTTVEKVRVL